MADLPWDQSHISLSVSRKSINEDKSVNKVSYKDNALRSAV